MNLSKRLAAGLGVVILAVLSVIIYLNHHYLVLGSNPSNSGHLEFLRRAQRIYPINDEPWFELGRFHLESAVSELGDIEISRDLFRSADQNLRRAIAIDPFSPFSHYYRGQALHYLSFLDPAFQEDPFREFEHAAFLAAHKSEIYYEVGKLMFSRWPDLDESQRTETIEILKKIPEEGRREKIETLLQIWKLNVLDYEVMKSILPRNASFYRIFADFLGRESLSLQELLIVKAEAERMRFEWGRREFEVGERLFFNYSFQDAFIHFKNGWDTLTGMQYFQELTGTDRIDPEEIAAFDKDVHLYLAKCLLEDGRGIREADIYLSAFMDKEDRVSAFGDLERYLVTRGFLQKRGRGGLDDVDALLLRLRLDFKQNRYRECIGKAALIESGMSRMEEKDRAAYIEILRILAESYQKLDSLYDAETYFEKTLELDPGNLTILMKFRSNAVRLNDFEKSGEIDNRISQLVSPKQIVGRFVLERNRDFDQSVRWHGRPVRLILEFEPGSLSHPPPLVSVFINGRVHWQSYIEQSRLSLLLESRIGDNRILVSVANATVVLKSISWEEGGLLPEEKT